MKASDAIVQFFIDKQITDISQPLSFGNRRGCTLKSEMSYGCKFQSGQK